MPAEISIVRLRLSALISLIFLNLPLCHIYVILSYFFNGFYPCSR